MMFKLPFNFSKKKNPQHFLTVDIGSNSVKAFVFEIVATSKGNVASIVGIGKQNLPHGATRGGSIVDVEDVSRALSHAVQIAANAEFDVKDAIFGVGGNLVYEFMTTVRVVRTKEGPINQKEINQIIEKVNMASLEQAQNKAMEIKGSTEKNLQIITSSIIYTKLDGVPTDDLLEKVGKRLELAVYTAYVPSYHLENLQEVASNAGLDILAVGSNTYSVVKSLTYSVGKEFDGVIMDIGGGITKVGVVFSGGIVDSRCLDIGGDDFTRELSKAMDLSYMDAEHRKLEYAYGRLNESDAMLVQGYMDNLLDVWLHGIELTFQEFSGVKTFASRIYLIGGGAELPDIFEVVSKEPWSRSIPFKSPPEFSKIRVEDLSLVSDKTGKAHGMEDVVPSALSIVYFELEGLDK